MVLGEHTSEKLFADIKNDFFKAYKENIGLGKYHKLDLERLRKNNDWLKAFYKYSTEDPEKTVAMLHEVLTWRNEFGANDLLVSGEPPVTEDYFKRGATFYRNEDINCIPMLHFRVKTHKKSNYPAATVQRFISYFFESKYMFNLDDPIVLVFDMTDAGYSNLDMDMIQFVVTCLKTYYPGLIDYLIVYQMPFIFNAAWKIIKNWLPPASVNLIKFCDKKSIKEYVQDSQLFDHMGGTDKYKYVYDPSMFILKEKFVEEPVLNESSRKSATISQYQLETITSVTSDQAMVTPFQTNGLIKIASRVSTISDYAQLVNDQDKEQTMQSANRSSAKLNTNTELVNKIYDAAASLDQTPENQLTTALLTITPGDELTFNVTDGKQDITRFIKLTNTSEQYLAYKIKITSPDKFRVKPGTGIIPVGGNASIMINYLKEFHNSVVNHRDKFLILWVPIDKELESTNLTEFWKQSVAKKLNINEHKVKCLIKQSAAEKSQSSPEQIKIDSMPSDHDLPISPSSYSVNSSISPRETAKPTQGNKNSKKKEKFNFTESTKPVEPIAKTKIEKMGMELSLLSNSPNETTIPAVKLDDSKHKLDKLQKDMNSLLENQDKLNKQYSQLIYLVYFLIMLNFLQLVFQSNLFTQIMEPFIDSVLFD